MAGRMRFNGRCRCEEMVVDEKLKLELMYGVSAVTKKKWPLT